MNISNVASLVDAEGKPHFKYIVEGANLFLTQQARLFLEKRKVVLFKDSSANKGQSKFGIQLFVFPNGDTQVVSQVPPLKCSPDSVSPMMNTST